MCCTAAGKYNGLTSLMMGADVVPLQEPGHTQVIIIEGLACDIVLVAREMLELWLQVTPYLHARVAQVEGDRDG